MTLVLYDNDFPVAVLSSYKEVAEWFGVTVDSARYYAGLKYRERKGVGRYVVKVDDCEEVTA